MIRWKSLPPGVRRLAAWAGVVLLLLLAVAFVAGFTAGRVYERWRSGTGTPVGCN